MEVSLFMAICSVESDYRNISKMDGKSMSYGPCQIKCSTARIYNEDLNCEDLRMSHVSIVYAGMHLKDLLSRYKKEDCAIKAYNAGSCRKNNYKYLNKVKKRKDNFERTGRT
jgi:hypothetical protein